MVLPPSLVLASVCLLYMTLESCQKHDWFYLKKSAYSERQRVGERERERNEHSVFNLVQPYPAILSRTSHLTPVNETGNGDGFVKVGFQKLRWVPGPLYSQSQLGSEGNHISNSRGCPIPLT